MLGARKGGDNTYASANKNAIQAAIETANNLGVRPVRVPSGTFVVSDKINLPKNYNVMIFGYGRGSIIKGGEGFTGEIFYYGGLTAAGGTLSAIQDIELGGALSGSCNGIKAQNANTGQIKGVLFRGCTTCIEMENSFAVKITRCDFLVPVAYGIYSSTSCHNLLVDTNWFWTAGLAALSIAGVSNNIVVTNNDMEYCNTCIQTSASVRSLIFTGNYVEGSVDREFNFGSPIYGFTCENNVIELRGAVPGSGVGSGAVSSYDNIIGGSFRYNAQFEQKISFSSTCAGITVVPGSLTGSTVISSLSALPYKDPGSLLNNWSKADNVTYPVGYSRDGDGNVHLKGQITSGSGSTGNTAFTLPVGYRPLTRQVMSCTVGGGTVAQVIVDTNGNVVPTLAQGNSLWLDAIKFPAIGGLS
nr:glycosyl hydrolase family 28-related protein [Brucella anthropi]